MRRAIQFLRALVARVREEELQSLGEYLTPAQMELFRRMPYFDQRHSLNVFRALRARGYDDPDLLVAALLHDVGKAGGTLQVWHRAIVALARVIEPRLLNRLAKGDPRSWRYPFFVHLRHPERGAELAQAAGCSPTTVELIRRHHDPAANPRRTRLDELLAALQEVDGRS